MGANAAFVVQIFIRFFFLLAPFFVISTFLSLTHGWDVPARRKLAIHVCLAVLLSCLILFFAGEQIFALFGITVDAFRVGAGALLFLSAVSLVREGGIQKLPEGTQDIAVVPLAIPITVGPATVGALLVMGADMHTLRLRMLGCIALTLASLSVGVMLYAAAWIQRVVGQRCLSIMSKLTGLILSAIAAQMIFTGVRHFLQ